MQPNFTPEQIIHLVAAVLGFYAIIFAVILTAIIVPTWFICKKAGFSPWLSFIVIVPFGGLVLLYVLAFADWKVVPMQQAALPYYPPQAPLPPTQPMPPHA
jgi:hypothetical protein